MRPARWVSGLRSRGRLFKSGGLTTLCHSPLREHDMSKSAPFRISCCVNGSSGTKEDLPGPYQRQKPHRALESGENVPQATDENDPFLEECVLAMSNLSVLREEQPEAFRYLCSAMRALRTRVRPSLTKVKARNTLIAILTEQICELLPGSRVCTFGSIATGTDTYKSDIDLTVLYSDADSTDKSVLRDVMFYLKEAENAKRSGIRHIAEVDAKVHILKLKCQDTKRTLRVDIAINNVLGVANSNLLRLYSNLDARVGILNTAVKQWAGVNRLLGSNCNHLNSYSYSILVINYLQKGVQPPVLPVIHADRPELFPDGDMTSFLISENPELKPYSESANHKACFDLFVGFVKYYSSFKYELEAIDITRRERIDRSTCQDDKWKPVLIIDPVGGMNPARCLTETNLSKLITSLRQLNEVLWSGDRNGYSRDMQRHLLRPLDEQRAYVEKVSKALNLPDPHSSDSSSSHQ